MTNRMPCTLSARGPAVLARTGTTMEHTPKQIHTTGPYTSKPLFFTDAAAREKKKCPDRIWTHTGTRLA